jgi:cytochrome c oxidase assembly factor CtaG
MRSSQLRAVSVAIPVSAGWTFATVVLIALAGYVVVYVLRWRRSREQGGERAAPVGRLVLWCTGVLLLFVALVSPVDALGEQLASVHMVQHLLIADLAPICLTLGLTKWILRPVGSSGRRGRSGIRRSASSPTSARCGSGTSRRSTTRRCATAACTCSST